MSSTTRPVIKDCIAYLQAHPELHTVSSRNLARQISEPKCGYTTWARARTALSLPTLSRWGVRYTKSPKQERKAAFAIYPNTHKIVVDTEHLKIVFHGDNGFKIAEKASKKALSASLRLFRLAKFETRSHDLETGIMVLTLKSEALEGRAA